jgi:hypothetical protein
VVICQPEIRMVEIYGEQEKTHYQNDRILGSVLKQQPAQQTNKPTKKIGTFQRLWSSAKIKI